LGQQLEAVLEMRHLRYSTTNEACTLYSLRHSCIMYRLLFGRGIDTLTLARNARTSQDDRSLLRAAAARRDECGHAAEQTASAALGITGSKLTTARQRLLPVVEHLSF